MPAFVFVCVCIVFLCVPFFPGRELESDTGLARPFARSDLIMLLCPPSLLLSFFISCMEKREKRWKIINQEKENKGGETGGRGCCDFFI